MTRNERKEREPRLSRFATGSFLAWLGITVGWWVLAFAPLAAPPEWLERARSVCFGTLPSGLPDTYGWILLVLGPLSMLSFLVAVWGRELWSSGRWLARRPTGVIALAVVVLGPTVGLAWVGERVETARRLSRNASSLPEDTGPLPDHYPRGTEPAPGFTLTDQDGHRVSLGDLRGEPVLLTFAYAHCSTVCPVIVETARRAVRAVPEAEASVVIVTLDPWRDTPRTLPALAESWRLEELSSARVLSGEVPAVQSVHEEYNVPTVRNRKTGEISHPALVFLIDDRGRLAYTFNGASARWLADGLRRLGTEG